MKKWFLFLELMAAMLIINMLVNTIEVRANENNTPESAYENLLLGDFSYFSGYWQNGNGDYFLLHEDGRITSCDDGV